MIIDNSISLRQPFISRHHTHNHTELAEQKTKAARLFVSYIFEKSLNQTLENNKMTATGEPLSNGSILARQQMNSEVAKIISQSSNLSETIAQHLK